MKRYLIESDHTAEDCTRAIKEFINQGYIHNFEWGCKDNVHKGYAIIEADNHAHALMSVPTLLRDKARAVELVRFGRRKEDTLHQPDADKPPAA